MRADSRRAVIFESGAIELTSENFDAADEDCRSLAAVSTRIDLAAHDVAHFQSDAQCDFAGTAILRERIGGVARPVDFELLVLAARCWPSPCTTIVTVPAAYAFKAVRVNELPAVFVAENPASVTSDTVRSGSGGTYVSTGGT